jgi:hypothetical protein
MYNDVGVNHDRGVVHQSRTSRAPIAAPAAAAGGFVVQARTV